MTAAKFYEELAKTKEKMVWYLRDGTDIRAHFKNNRGCFCPITAVVRQKNNVTYVTTDYGCAGEELKLNEEFVTKVANAADDYCEKGSKTRKHLLKVLGLTENKVSV